MAASGNACGTLSDVGMIVKRCQAGEATLTRPPSKASVKEVMHQLMNTLRCEMWASSPSQPNVVNPDCIGSDDSLHCFGQDLGGGGVNFHAGVFAFVTKLVWRSMRAVCMSGFDALFPAQRQIETVNACVHSSPSSRMPRYKCPPKSEGSCAYPAGQRAHGMGSGNGCPYPNCPAVGQCRRRRGPRSRWVWLL